MLWPMLAGAILLLASCGAPSTSQPTGKGTASTLAVQPAAKTPELGAVQMLSPTVSLAGGLGVILRSTNDGRGWQPVDYPAGNVQGFDQVNATTVFAVANRGLYESQNAGATWRTVNTHTHFSQVVFVNGRRGFGLEIGPNSMAAGPVLVTGDGGRTWSAASPGFTALSMCFTSAQTGFALGAPPSFSQGPSAPGTLYATHDGGKTWQTLQTVPGNWGSGELHCAGSGVWVQLYGQAGMSQESYAIFHSVNGGETWQAVAAASTAGGGPAPGNPKSAAQAPGSSPQTMAAVGSQFAYVLGSCDACGSGGTVLPGWTQDGGQSFTASTTPIAGLSPASPIAVSFATQAVGMIVSHPNQGLSVVLTTKDSGQTWQVAAYLSSPNPVHGISFVSPTVGFGLSTATDAEAVLETTDGGVTWRQVGRITPGYSGPGVPVPFGPSPFSIAFISQSTGFAVGGNGQLMESQDGGRSWHAVASVSQAGPISAVSFASPQDGCASMFSPAGSSGLWATSDGGRQWTQLATSSPVAVFAQTQSVLVLGCAAALANPGFESGLPPLPRGSYALMAAVPGGRGAVALLFTGASSAPNGQLLTAALGSREWVSHALPLGQFQPFSFSFLSPSQGFVTTAGGRLFETTDGGQTWTQLP